MFSDKEKYELSWNSGMTFFPLRVKRDFVRPLLLSDIRTVPEFSVNYDSRIDLEKHLPMSADEQQNDVRPMAAILSTCRQQVTALFFFSPQYKSQDSSSELYLKAAMLSKVVRKAILSTLTLCMYTRM